MLLPSAWFKELGTRGCWSGYGKTDCIGWLPHIWWIITTRSRRGCSVVKTNKKLSFTSFHHHIEPISINPDNGDSMFLWKVSINYKASNSRNLNNNSCKNLKLWPIQVTYSTLLPVVVRLVHTPGQPKVAYFHNIVISQ